LHQAVAENARNAALRDPRFSPVQPGELGGIKIEISVLTEPLPLPYTSPDDLLSKLHPNEDGVAAAHRPAHGDVPAAGLGADPGQG